MAMRRWRAPAIVLEDVQTGDGRVMAPLSVEWADLPLPLAWLRDGDQHVSLTEVAPQIGVIEELSRSGNAIPAVGVIDDENPDGAEVIRRMESGTAPLGNRFPVSIDPDNWEVQIVATDAEDDGEIILLAAAGHGPLTAASVRATVVSALRAAAGDPDPGEDGGDDGVVLFEDVVDAVIERYTRIRIRGATLCSVAAFDGAFIELEAADATAETEPPTEAAPEAVAAAVPARPPSAWFSEPEPEAGDDRLIEQLDGGWAVPLTILDSGQVFGHIARRDQAHRGYVGRHVAPPTSASGYREFHVGQVVCDDGSHVATGALVVGCDHAPPSMTLLEARDHYAHAGMGWADGRIIDGAFGPWFAGALRPGLGEEDLRVLRALTPSGDWRPVNGTLELVAVQSVNVPGFPVAREALAASSLRQPAAAMAAPRIGLAASGEVASLVAAGMVARCSECAERERERAALTAAMASTDAVLAALAQVRSDTLTALARLERRTRHLEPLAASALAERVHANGR
jgi:hypothetical protein